MKNNIRKLHIQLLSIGLACMQSIIYSTTFKLGLENIPTTYAQKTIVTHPIRFALITNHTGKNLQGKRTLDVLRGHGLHITCILAPEHGFSGTVAAGDTVHNEYDAKTNIPIFSLYKHGTGKAMDHELYDTIDAFIFDMQEAGMRHYTYLSTLLYTMYAAAAHNKLFVVLDRPNILGNRIEGPLLSVDVAEKKSFIAAAHIPLRHGMTIGELATYFNNHILEKPIHLEVIKMEGYTRQTALPSTLAYNLSPNIINKQSCYGYSFLGLLGEIRPCDIGLGTSHPFATIGLPEKILNTAQWRQLQTQLRSHGIATTLHTYTRPQKKITYTGLRLHINAIEQVHAFEALLNIMQFLKKNRVTYSFSPHFDQAIGTALVQQYIQGTISRAVLTTNVNNALKQFWNQARDSFLYEPWPLITLMH